MVSPTANRVVRRARDRERQREKDKESYSGKVTEQKREETLDTCKAFMAIKGFVH